mmetsp:Transcript_35408/g.56771  ORF Transcript_35408/g.56771 Transcript_35408/m.56771 type:complete len:155 (-) Transcript_35408:273-737(-)
MWHCSVVIGTNYNISPLTLKNMVQILLAITNGQRSNVCRYPAELCAMMDASAMYCGSYLYASSAVSHNRHCLKIAQMLAVVFAPAMPGYVRAVWVSEKLQKFSLAMPADWYWCRRAPSIQVSSLSLDWVLLQESRCLCWLRIVCVEVRVIHQER